ncbi:DUF1798 domain-containing protein [Pueribacillus theae]|uniref:DUF1798 domain-containing protein n=1 Tax=Pueribacillus theae TaxID=2171751 RepID=A0A2U1JUM2_9BACI|nr:YppE family protein [Pueribacillus theae]PWA08900.1 DUF1798 domain-containing protein [Pueribacillus theae]
MAGNSEQSLINLTKKLLDLNNKAYSQYVEHTKHEGYESDFYNEVKPFSDEVLKVAGKWKEAALEWLGEGQVKYLYPIQIENAFENLLITSVQAFQKDTAARKFNERRFIEMIKSVDYVLNTMLSQLKS